MSISDDLALLTPGSTFVNKKGRVAKLLWVTNVSLLTTADEATQNNHPVQVVYANEDNEVFNRELDDFIKRYRFYNVDPELESRLDNLLVFSEDDHVPDEDDTGPLGATASQIGLVNARKTGRISGSELHAGNIAKRSVVDDVPATDAMWAPTQTNKIVADALTVGDEEEGLLLPPQQADVDAEANAARDLSTAVRVVFNTLSGSLVGTSVPDRLSNALVAYGQEPDITQSLIIHRLTFALDEELTIEALQNLFRPRETEGDTRHTIDVFDVQTAYASDVIVWTSYIGVFPDYNRGGLYATVMVGTDEVRALPAEVEQVEEQLTEFVGQENTQEVRDAIVDTLSGQGQQDGTPIVAAIDVTQTPAHLQPGYAMTEEGKRGVQVQISPNAVPSQNGLNVQAAVDSGTAETAKDEATLFQAKQLQQNSTQPNPHTQGIHIHPSIDQLFQQPGADTPGAL
jgi:hypothetical protein